MIQLQKEEINRYARHIILDQVGLIGQEKLKNSSVLIVGLGGLGAPVAMYLAASGIGRLGLVDFDSVDISNLQRQVIHHTSDVGKLKVESAKEKLMDINPFLNVDLYPEAITSENANRIFSKYDIVVDGSDNFNTRYLVNKTCVEEKKPLVFGSIYKFEGQVSVFGYNNGPCYECLFPDMPDEDALPSCSEAGVLGVLPGVIGVVQATEVIKIVLNKGESLSGRLLVYDAMAMRFNELTFKKNEHCAVCGNGVKKSGTTQVQCANDTGEVSLISLEEIYKMGETRFTLVDIRSNEEYEKATLSGAINIPMDQVFERLKEIPTDKEVVFFCNLGVKSKKVAEAMMDQFSVKVHSLLGGVVSELTK